MDVVEAKLENRQSGVQQVGYAVCLEEPILKELQLESRKQVLKLIKTSDLVPETSRAKNIVLVNEGDQDLWQMLQLKKLEPSSYYVHSHISDDYICLKLYQMVDTKKSKREASTLLIQERVIQINDVYKEAAELIFSYIQFLGEEEETQICNNKRPLLSIEDFRLFKDKIIHFIKEDLFNGHQHKATCVEIDCIKHKCTVAIQELVDVAIIPILKRVVNTVVTSLINRDIFGRYDIAKLFLTGHFLRVKNYSESYHYLIEKKLRETLEDSLLHKSYSTAFDISINTCQKQPSHNPSVKLNQKHFCYDKLIWGELQIVSNSTYLLRKFLSNKHLISVGIDGEETTYGQSSVVLLQHEQFLKKRLKLNTFFDDQGEGWKKAFMLEIYDLGDHNAIHELSNLKAPGGLRFRTNSNIPPTIQVEYLPYCSCIKFSSNYYNEENGVLNLETEELWMIGRQVLKYF